MLCIYIYIYIYTHIHTYIKLSKTCKCDSLPCHFIIEVYRGDSMRLITLTAYFKYLVTKLNRELALMPPICQAEIPQKLTNRLFGYIC